MSYGEPRLDSQYWEYRAETQWTPPGELNARARIELVMALPGEDWSIETADTAFQALMTYIHEHPDFEVSGGQKRSGYRQVITP
ncbi:hypothetical protein ACQEU8_02450 [Streptomyces sp. CA-250714]|uniref:hypothetical protein n=1 Tax=Streptomyces sp. CA-250714 TaxID=3240060 RepID=UPI003D94E6BF